MSATGNGKWNEVISCYCLRVLATSKIIVRSVVSRTAGGLSEQSTGQLRWQLPQAAIVVVG